MCNKGGTQNSSSQTTNVFFLPRRRSPQRCTQPGMSSNGGVWTPRVSTKSENTVTLIAGPVLQSRHKFSRVNDFRHK